MTELFCHDGFNWLWARKLPPHASFVWTANRETCPTLQFYLLKLSCKRIKFRILRIYVTDECFMGMWSRLILYLMIYITSSLLEILYFSTINVTFWFLLKSIGNNRQLFTGTDHPKHFKNRSLKLIQLLPLQHNFKIPSVVVSDKSSWFLMTIINLNFFFSTCFYSPWLVTCDWWSVKCTQTRTAMLTLETHKLIQRPTVSNTLNQVHRQRW